MRMLSRSIPVAALALAFGAVSAAAQESGQRDFQWYIGPQAGVMLFDTPVQDRQAMPSFGGQTLIVARRTGLLLSVEEGVGDDEVSAYNDLSGTQTVTFNDIRKYSAVLMAFPIKAAAQPYLGVGWGIMHTVSPRTTGAFQSDAEDLGSSGFGTVVMAGTNWMSFEATKRSYELMMRYVMPRFNRANARRDRSFDFVFDHREEFSGANQAAIDKAVASGGRG